MDSNTRRRLSEDDDKDEGPKPKRQRVSRACDQCRASRDRCDGKAPCQTCTANQRSCTYTTAPKKRGIQPGYIRALELSLASLLSRDGANRQALASSLTDGGALRKSIGAKDVPRDGPTDDLHSRWSSSLICQQIDAILSGGPDVNMDALQDELLGVNTELATDGQDLLVSLPAQPIHFDAELSHPASIPTAPTQLVLPTDFWSILDHYYTFTHNWLPISDKNDILKTSYSYPVGNRDIYTSAESRASHGELWAVIALTCRLQSRSNDQVTAAVKIARACLSAENISRPEPGQIRSHILLSLLAVGEGNTLSAWLDIGIATRLFLHHYWQSPLAFTVPNYVRLALGLFVIDAILCGHVRAPPHMNNNRMPQFDTTRLPEDGLEEWSPWHVPQGYQSTILSESISRRPSRCLSTFNLLVGIASKTGPSDTLPPAGAAVESLYTPHQLHVAIITEWFRYLRTSMTYAQMAAKLLPLVNRFQTCGGAEAVPPSLIPILRNILASRNVDSVDDTPYMFVVEVVFKWDRSVSKPVYNVAHNINNDSHSITLDHFMPFQAPSSTSATYSGDQSMGPRPHRTSTAAQDHGMVTANHETPSAVSDSGAANADLQAIFDEFARLNETSQADNGSQFMQNLGLGPESDLKAFFGADYQEMDPLLSYLSFDKTFNTADAPTFTP